MILYFMMKQKNSITSIIDEYQMMTIDDYMAQVNEIPGVNTPKIKKYSIEQ